jgi:FeS assembly SUF system protein
MADKPALQLNVLQPNAKLEQLKREPRATTAAAPPEAGSALEAQIITALRTIYDPEIPLNIYDLGLIYAIDVSPETDAKITMTLTAPGCPVAGEIVAQVQRKTSELAGIKSASVNLVFDPPWSKDRMSEAALLELGLL